jgi:K(+)-stimulated pyrophosphate-energized sodium pump
MLTTYAAIIGCGLLAILYGVIMIQSILKKSTGTEQMRELSSAIQEGASAYLGRQYLTITLVGTVIFAIITALLGWHVGIGFLIGAVLSGLTGFVGMNVSVRANVRTTEAAKTGLTGALNIAFNAGAVTGMLVVGLALLGMAGYYVYLRSALFPIREILEALIGLSFGGSLISIFARLGGGIFTKGADVGADVGDNVGDCAGMAADLFETYIVTIVGAMLLAGIFFQGALQETMMAYPLAIGAVGIIASILGTFFVRLGKTADIMGALYKGFTATALFSLAGIALLTHFLLGFETTFTVHQMTFTGLNIFICALVGIVSTGLIMKITEYYTMTNYRPVTSIAKASQSGHGPNIIQGLAVSMEATGLPVIVICIGIIISYMNAHLFGISIAATSMLALAGMVTALDAYGPVTDNAGGIAEMAHLDASVRKTTDALDAVGNTTKAVTKGYAICSAGFASIVLFTAFIEDLGYYFPGLQVDFSLSNPFVVIGLFAGGLLPYLFGSMGMMAVGRAAASVVEEVRRQFRDIPGIMEGTGKPEYGKAVDMLTKSAIKEMILPSLLPVLAPILVCLIVRYTVNEAQAFATLGAMLLGVVVTGLFVAISMTAGGGAWDNAKKFIEDGHFGGKGSEAHKAAVTGDTVGDPYKDTAGPAINPLIKIANIVALLLLAVLSSR